MCTVTYVPIAGGFVFTSNRDEDPQRSAQKIVEDKRGEVTLTFPQDEGAHGTWFSFSDADQFACILNGAFEPHVRKDHYSMSRGLMALAFFDYENIDAFLDSFAFEGIEPFTLLLYCQGDFRELKWDETDLHHRTLPTDQIHLWSSCTLYTHDWWMDRAISFKEFVVRQQPDQKGIISYHKTELPFVPEALQARLSSPKPLTNLPLKTTSVSSILKNDEGFDFHFHRMDERFNHHKIIN